MIYGNGQSILQLERSEYDGVNDRIEHMGRGLFRWVKTIDKRQIKTQDLQRIKMKARLAEGAEFYMIPGVMYNGNPWGEGMEPKGTARNGIPWKFAWHRSGVPAGIFCQMPGWTAGMWGSLSNSYGFSAGLEEKEGKVSGMEISFPEEEAPVVYCARDTYAEQSYIEAVADSEPELIFTIWLKIGYAEKPYDYMGWLNTVWQICGMETDAGEQNVLPGKKVWDLGIRFLAESAWFRSGSFSGFCMGLTWNGHRWEQRRDYLEIGWVGQNASCALSLICDGLLTNSRERVEQGMEVLDCWLSCRLDNGLFRCRYDLKEKNREAENHEEIQDAANLYSAVDEYLEAWRVLKSAGIEREEYKDTALGICQFAMETQEPDGCMGKAWYNDGTCAQRDGSIGCYMVLALCRAAEETGDDIYMEPIVRGYRFYMAQYMQNGFTTAGALDTCCIDKESALPLLKTALFLYERTGEKEYLGSAVDISTYIASWQYQYDVAFPDHTVLGRIGYRTRGGTAVSTQHHHIDCYGLFIYEDWIKLANHTGDHMWRTRADALWQNSLQNISDGTLSVKGQLRPAGSQDEGFLQTRWHTKKGEYFGVSEWLVVWNTAFRLKILRKDYLARNREKSKLTERI